MAVNLPLVPNGVPAELFTELLRIYNAIRETDSALDKVQKQLAEEGQSPDVDAAEVVPKSITLKINTTALAIGTPVFLIYSEGGISAVPASTTDSRCLTHYIGIISGPDSATIEGYAKVPQGVAQAPVLFLTSTGLGSAPDTEKIIPMGFSITPYEVYLSVRPAIRKRIISGEVYA